jgi:hypothetical protein
MYINNVLQRIESPGRIDQGTSVGIFLPDKGRLAALDIAYY